MNTPNDTSGASQTVGNVRAAAAQAESEGLRGILDSLAGRIGTMSANELEEHKKLTERWNSLPNRRFFEGIMRTVAIDYALALAEHEAAKSDPTRSVNTALALRSIEQFIMAHLLSYGERLRVYEPREVPPAT